ncbi:MAG: YdeI/OmpD-associated family protein [Anaerolineales bacterium]|nr:YdeI/OmpD-associated family protein [Anaerolineales bacterium]
MDSQTKQFRATIKLDGINPYVDAPDDVQEDWGGQGPVPVLLRVAPVAGPAADNPEGSEVVLPRDADRLRAIGRLTGDGWFRTTIVTRRSDAPRLYLDQWMRANAALSVGDEAQVTLRYDSAPRALALPETFLAALEEDPEAMASWNGLSPSRQREILSYLNFLKTPEALERNVRKTVENLKE